MKYIDLTLNYKNGMRGFDAEPAKTVAVEGWNAQTLHIYSHAGTHMDAPLHFDVSNQTIDLYPVHRFFVSCWLIRMPEIEDSYLITTNDLGDVLEKIKAGEGLLFHTGWSKYAGKQAYREKLPRISVELANWCVSRQVSFIGVEPPSVADVNNLNELSEVHHILLKGDILIVEGLTNLNRISAEKIDVVALPLKITNGDGAPCRVIAIEK